MLRTKKADQIICVAIVVMLLAAVFLWGVVEPVQGDGSHTVGYESLLFDQNTVHTIDIAMPGWDDFIANATAEEYTGCSISIDGEKFNNVGIRPKGNTSLSSVASLGSTRYSFKVEFDCYVKGKSYHGLDKLSLNNLIQDATMMKDYLAYTLMNRMDVPSPLCSYVQIKVNGEPWGLYLAVEGVEDAFMDRNGMDKGDLYKPDSMSFGGGRGNGGDFDLEQFRVKDDMENANGPSSSASPMPNMPSSAMDNGNSFGELPSAPADAPENIPQVPLGDFSPSNGNGTQDAADSPNTASQPESVEKQGERRFPEFDGNGFGGFSFGMGSDDVKLIYSNDDADSYSNIFNNAKTKITTVDKARLIEALRRLNAREDMENTVNRDEVIRYLAVHNFLCNGDSYTGMMVHNYYLYEEKGKLSMIPWDYNLGFGGFSASSDATSTVNSPIDSPVSGGTVDSRPLISWIFSDEEALVNYHTAYDRFISENIENGWLMDEINRVQQMITPYLEKDGTAFYNMEEYGKAMNTLRTFCQKRSISIRGQLLGTIPSTSQGQQENSSVLVDAADISTSDMGSMNNGKNGPGDGGFRMPSGGPGEPPDFSNPAGFILPSELPETFVPDDNNSLGISGEVAQASTPVPEQMLSSDKPIDTSMPDAPKENSVRPDGVPSNGDVPAQLPSNRSGEWLLLAVWSIILLAAIFILRRAGCHND